MTDTIEYFVAGTHGTYQVHVRGVRGGRRIMDPENLQNLCFLTVEGWRNRSTAESHRRSHEWIVELDISTKELIEHKELSQTHQDNLSSESIK